MIDGDVGIIDFLKSKPFVHIVSEPRSGSSSLFYALQEGHEPEIDLNEPFHFKDKRKTDETLTYLTNHINGCKVMKNHGSTLLELSPNDQERIWGLPAYVVGLTRRDWFSQSCSLAIAEYTKSWDIAPYEKINIPISFYEKRIDQLIAVKRDSFKQAHHFHLNICYEDIKFPKSLSYRHLVSVNNISNIEEIKAIYDKFKTFYTKYLRLAD